jgi:DNA-binding beta-propeller fold protein YncE
MEISAMTRLGTRCIPALCLLAAISAQAQEPPRATELPDTAFAIKHTWFLGGTGNWDYLTMDAQANRLYIAHGRVVQVVDVETGTLAGQIEGLRDAHDIALDSSGEFGYISDGPADQVKVFDRRTFQIVATIATGPTPRALTIDEQTGLLFVVCTNPVTGTPPQSAGQPGTNGTPRRPVPPPASSAANRNQEIKTSISVIDLASRKRVGEILMPARLGFAQSDGNGGVYVLLINHSQVARLDTEAIAGRLHKTQDGAGTGPHGAAEPGQTGNGESGQAAAAEPVPPGDAGTSSPRPASDGAASEAADKKDGDSAELTVLDWSQNSPPDAMKTLPLGSGCADPRSLAVDGAHQRLFAACNNMKLTVLNTGSGEVVASLPIGPGADTVGYDAARGLIYTANGGAQGSLTVIRQDVTDTYAEIQNLPTRQRARTLAFNQQTGELYLVTDFVGVNVAKSGGIGTLKTVPVAGSFQVLVIGH